MIKATINAPQEDMTVGDAIFKLSIETTKAICLEGVNGSAWLKKQLKALIDGPTTMHEPCIRAMLFSLDSLEREEFIFFNDEILPLAKGEVESIRKNPKMPHLTIIPISGLSWNVEAATRLVVFLFISYKFEEKDICYEAALPKAEEQFPEELIEVINTVAVMLNSRAQTINTQALD